jgi:hypothetical protein
VCHLWWLLTATGDSGELAASNGEMALIRVGSVVTVTERVPELRALGGGRTILVCELLGKEWKCFIDRGKMNNWRRSVREPSSPLGSMAWQKSVKMP